MMSVNDLISMYSGEAGFQASAMACEQNGRSLEI
jgi:hypothetical protein